jgi:hypothetical protein
MPDVGSCNSHLIALQIERGMLGTDLPATRSHRD